MRDPQAPDRPPERGIVLLIGAPPIVRPVVGLLRDEGLSVVRAPTARTGRRLLAALRPDVVVLDVDLPGGEGWELLEVIRATDPQVSLIVWSGRADEGERVRGLELGADDYVPEPLAAREVAARIERCVGDSRDRATVRPPLRFRDALRLDPLRHEAYGHGRPAELSPLEFEVLYAMARRPGFPLSRCQLARESGASLDGQCRGIDRCVVRLRRKLGRVLSGRRVVRTQVGLGYYFDPGALGGGA
jgi:DNA-binding response OmpR family regulator